MDLLFLVPGVAVAVVAYFVYLAATKGLPVALAKAKAWWTRGKADLVGLKGDVTAAQAKLATIPDTIVADVERLKADIAALQANVMALLAKVP
jgi:hypothetical protein